MTDKYKAACVEYAEAKASVKALTEGIGEFLSECHKEQGDGEYVDHLKMAYTMTSDIHDHECGGTFRGDPYFEHHDGDPGLYLMGLCKHCYRAHVYIQARKEARQRFGIAKRRIGLLGLAVIKNQALPTED